MARILVARWLWVVFAVALLARAAYVLAAQPDPMGMIDSTEYDRAARHLLAGGGFSDGLGFVRPPLYVVFVAASYALGGLAALQAAQVVLGALTAVLVGVLARGLRTAPGAEVAAGLVAAFYPWSFQLVGGLASETLFTFVAVAAFALVLHASRARSLRRVLAAGVVFALASLARANILMLGPFIALWWWWRDRSPVRPAVLGLTVVASLLPFTAYNLAAGNGFVLASSGGGISFAIGNNPEMALLYSGRLSDDEWRDVNAKAGRTPPALEWFGCRYVDDWRELCTERVGIAERERFFYAAGLRYITTRTGEWLGLEVGKLLHYWRPWVDPRSYPIALVVLSGISFGAILALALWGVRRLALPQAVFVVAIAIGATITVLIWVVQLRYRFALLDPVLIAAAGAPLADLARAAFRAVVRPARPSGRQVPEVPA